MFYAAAVKFNPRTTTAAAAGVLTAEDDRSILRVDTDSGYSALRYGSSHRLSPAFNN